MKDLFKLILTGNNSTPPEGVLSAFNDMFKEATAVEWHLEGKYFESIFVYKGKEIICRFDKASKWVDTRINQSVEEIGKSITEKIAAFGEIMSSILIDKPGCKLYEFVVRDRNMNRQIIFTDINGNVIEKRGFNSVYDLF